MTVVAAPATTSNAPAAAHVFDCIVCGIDDSERGSEAARQAARLLAPDGSLHLHAVADVAAFRRAGLAVAPSPADIVESLTQTLDRTAAEVRPSTSRLTKGIPVPTLLRRVGEEEATLLALGARRQRRAAGFFMGSVTTKLLHDAPCSVLLARPQRSGVGPPTRIVVGVDGSPHAEAAAACARALRARFGGWLFSAAALGGKAIDGDEMSRLDPNVILDARHPVDALLALAEAADLLVVGSRGLHGLASLGSVSERVAHLARCSVLVVRGVGEE
ncbi:MAG TPA: universal stress protein [Gaiellaceae bacterium]|nr:universal stress protein [Gaiellaceae bacterium]